MTQYASSPGVRPAYAKQVQEAKAKRQAVLTRVRKQRAQTQKRIAQAWMQEDLIIRARELKEQHQR
jgi:hypothetical protein